MKVEPPETAAPETAAVENKAFVVIVLTLILLIGVALWQFYSLAWAEVPKSSHTAISPDRPPTAASLAILSE